jgi:hypothetical protein
MIGVVIAATPPPPWIQRAPIPAPIVAWRLADVLGTPAAEGIAVDRDVAAGTLTVNVVDSRYNPPKVVKIRDVKGSRMRWLRTGTRDGLARGEIAVDVAGPAGETAYLLRVGRGLRLELERKVHGHELGPRTFSRYQVRGCRGRGTPR